MAGEKFARLIDLAKETSSEKRRVLLREVTEMFIDPDTPRTPASAEMFGEIVISVASDMEVAIRAEIAERFAYLPDLPRRLALLFANDEIAVASPILKHSPVLTDDDLLNLINKKGNDHRESIAGRPQVSMAVTDALVNQGDDRVLNVLLRNNGATLSQETLAVAVERAKMNSELHDPVVSRKELPADLLNDMYNVVSEQLRAKVLRRFREFAPAEIEAALERAKGKVAVADGALPADFAAAKAQVARMRVGGKVPPSQMVGLLRNNDLTAFVIAFSETIDLDFSTTYRMFQRKDVDAVAVACRASNLDRALFVSLAALTLGGDGGVGKAAALGETYNAVPVEAAQRALRFWRVRRAADPSNPLDTIKAS